MNLSLQAPILRGSQSTLGLNDFLMAQLAYLKLASSVPLNGKRPVGPTKDDASSSTQTAICKKLKPNGDAPAIHLAKQDTTIQKTSVKFKQPETKSRMAPRNVIVIDEEEDCLIIENPSTKTSSSPLICKENSIINSYFNSLLAPLTQSKFITENQYSEPLFAKKPEIVIIDNEQEDQLTCESTPIKQDNLSDCPENLELQKENSIQSDEKTAKGFDVEQCAKIPQLDKNQNQRKTRQVKLFWQPDYCGPEEFKLWVEEVQKAVRVEVTHEEKVLRTIKNFGMDLQKTLAGIKRNKAQYKEYFRLKKEMNFHY